MLENRYPGEFDLKKMYAVIRDFSASNADKMAELIQTQQLASGFAPANVGNSDGEAGTKEIPSRAASQDENSPKKKKSGKKS